MSRKTDHIRNVAIANLKASPTKSAVLGIAFVVLVVMVVRQLSGGAASASADPGFAEAIMPDMEPPQDASGAAAKRKPRPNLPPASARDPFATDWLSRSVLFSGDDTDKPADESADDQGELVLQCTMHSQLGLPALAVISGVVVFPGSKVDGYEVLSIGQRHAVLKSGTEELVLKMR